MVWELLEKGFNTVALKIFTSVKSSTFSAHFFCWKKGRFATQSAGPAALFISLCSHFLFLVMVRSYMCWYPALPCRWELHCWWCSWPTLSWRRTHVPHFILKLALQKVTNLCHFLPSCRDGKWLCRCKQHDLFAANTYQFFVKFPSLRESNCAVSVCASAENAVKALYTGWGILSAMGGKNCSDPCSCGWEGVICVTLSQTVVESGSCYAYSVIGLWVPNVSMPPMSMNFASWPTWTTRSYN